MTGVLLKNARVFDGFNGDCPENMQVLVEGGTIREVSSTPISAAGAHAIDVGGRTLMPGLIDAHIHAYAASMSIRELSLMSEAYRMAFAIKMLGFALDCGFTTVRDVGGGDYALWKAIEVRLIRAPRFFYAGKALTMTGGHGDLRQVNEAEPSKENMLAVMADGVDEVLKASREQLRRGAHFIKIMGSGGVASPTDPIWMNQYREDEIRAVVNEAVERRTYVSSHCHTAEGTRRAVAFGVRSIEHGTMIDEATANYVAGTDAFVVPTIVTIFAIVEVGKKLGVSPQSQEKAVLAYNQAIEGMEHMRKAGVKLGFGTDLLGSTYVQQCREFTLRKGVFSPLEILRQATSNNAELMMQKDLLGCIKPGARADLLVVDGDPLKDIEILAADGKNLRLIMVGGELIKTELH
jgi:imidazolonepropionase-like amidohydrolase